MKLVIHDRGAACNGDIRRHFGGDAVIVGERRKINHCNGCFGCWVKTPGQCVLEDSYKNMPEKLKEADDVVIISECAYGMYSPFVKNVLDRSIGYLHPYFAKRNGEMHHRQRYPKNLALFVYYYGETTEAERETAGRIAGANAVNLYADLQEVCFFRDFEKLMEEKG